MAITTESYPADGINKIFTVASTILSQSHCRVDFYYDSLDHKITSNIWDVINNSIVFNDAPTSGYVVKITISTDGEGLDTAPSIYSDLASNVAAVVTVSENIPNMVIVSDIASDVAKVATIDTDITINADNIVEIQNSEANAAIASTKADEAAASAASAALADVTSDNTRTLSNKTLDDSSNNINANKFNGKIASDYVLTVDYDDQDVLDKVKTVDGAGSGLDADLLDGLEASVFQLVSNMVDEDDMASNSDTKYPTQQSIKAYTDNINTWVANDIRMKTVLNVVGDAPIYPTRAFVNFDGAGTVSIRSSGNVSSITDNGTGQYKVNLTVAVNSGNETVVTGGARAADTTSYGYPIQCSMSSSTEVRITCRDSGSGEADWDVVAVSVQG